MRYDLLLNARLIVANVFAHQLPELFGALQSRLLSPCGLVVEVASLARRDSCVGTASASYALEMRPRALRFATLPIHLNRMLPVHRSEEVGLLRICWTLTQAAICSSFRVHRTCEPLSIVLRLESVPGGSIGETSCASVLSIIELHSLDSGQVVVNHTIIGVELVKPGSTETLAHIRRVRPIKIDVAPHLLERRANRPTPRDDRDSCTPSLSRTLIQLVHVLVRAESTSWLPLQPGRMPPIQLRLQRMLGALSGILVGARLHLLVLSMRIVVTPPGLLSQALDISVLQAIQIARHGLDVG